MSDAADPDKQETAPAVDEVATDAPAAEIASTEATPAPAENVAERLARIEESYAHVRSYADRTSGENAKLREEHAKAVAKLELLESQSARGVSSAQAADEQARFDREWKDRLAGNPEQVVDFVRGGLSEVRQTLRDEVLAELRKEMGAVTSKLGEFDPEYRSHKDQVDALMTEVPGLTRDGAIKIVKKFAPASPVSPPRPKTPGAAPVSRASAPPAPEPAFIPAAERELMRRVGLTDDHVKEIAVSMATQGRK